MSATPTRYPEDRLRAAHKASSLPVDQIRKSAQVGCFYCMKDYPSEEDEQLPEGP